MSQIKSLKVPDFKIQILTEEKLLCIQEATMEILENTGVKFPSIKALQILADSGADVDFNSQIAKLPQTLVTSALSSAPRSFTMGSRGNSTLDLHLDGSNIYIGGEGTGHTMIDLDTGERRPSSKSDVELMALITDYLSNPCFYWPVISARDVPKELVALHEIDASFNFTEKHVHIVSCVDENVSRYAVKMANVVSGGIDALRKRPPLSLLVCSVAPLAQDKGALESALVFAEAGLPVGFMSMPSMCSTSPATIASNLVIGNAEILSALVLIQLAYPGAPVFYSLCPEMMNPVTGGVYASALQKPLLYGGGVNLGHFNNLPVMTYYGGSDSYEVDKWITGKDKAIDSLFVNLTGPELVIAMGGLLEEYTVCHPELILLDNDIVNSIHTTFEGIEVSKDTLLIDEIAEVGPGGHFLDREHTKNNFRKLWNRGVVTKWSHERNCFKNAHEAALEEVRRIVRTHRPEPLQPAVRNELNKIIQGAERSLCS